MPYLVISTTKSNHWASIREYIVHLVRLIRFVNIGLFFITNVWVQYSEKWKKEQNITKNYIYVYYWQSHAVLSFLL